MGLGRTRARAIAKTPNSVSATSPKFQRVRWVDSIEAVRRLMEGDSVVPRSGRSSASRFVAPLRPLATVTAPHWLFRQRDKWVAPLRHLVTQCRHVDACASSRDGATATRNQLPLGVGRGDVMAQNNLGNLYRRELDDAAAVSWYAKLSHPTIRLRDFQPPHRFRFVIPSSNCSARLRRLLPRRGSPVRRIGFSPTTSPSAAAT
jgi:hypothetical protein